MQAQPEHVERAMEANLAVLRDTLGRLLHARTVQGAALIQGLRANPGAPEVYFDVVSASGCRVRVKLAPLTLEGNAFVRTRSFTVSFRSETSAPLDAVTRATLDRIAKEIETRDAGGRVLLAPGGTRGPNLFLSIAKQSPHRWSREVFDREFAATVAASGGRIERVVLVVAQPCEQQCVFCPQVDRDKSRDDWMEKGDREQFDDLLYQLQRGRSAGATVADFGGNDVLRFAPILELGRLARELGYVKVVVQSPALAMADLAFAEAIARSGITDVHLPIYGTTAAVHDAITGTPGAFDKLARALDHARSLGSPRMRLHTIALGSTLQQLGALIEFCRERFGIALHVQPLRPNRTGERDHLGDAPRFEALRPLIAQNPEPFADEFPACVYPLEEVVRKNRHALLLGEHGGPGSHLFDLGMSGEEHAQVRHDRSLLYGTACDGCLLRPACSGVLGAYLQAWGESELRPLTDAAELERAVAGRTWTTPAECARD